MTPQEMTIYAEAYVQNEKNRKEQRQHEIYASALLISQFVWAKGKKPSYDQVFPDSVQKEEMTDEEMLKKVMALNALFGGTDERKGAPQCQE